MEIDMLGEQRFERKEGEKEKDVEGWSGSVLVKEKQVRESRR